MGKRTIPKGSDFGFVSRVERDGLVTLPRGWASSWEHKIASFTGYLLELPIRYESGRRVPLAALKRGWFGQ